MNLFLRKFFTMSLVFLAVIVLIVEGVNFFVQKNIDLKINKNILILGDSQTQFSLNDDILSNSINLSESADTYFYSFIKLKNILPENPQIDTLFLGYSYHNISEQQDDWLKSSTINAYKFPLYYFLMNKKDTFKLFKQNMKAFLGYYFSSFKTNLGHLGRMKKGAKINKIGIGNYSRTLENNPQIRTGNEFQLEIGLHADLENLNKIINYCNKNNVKVILIAAPLYKNAIENGIAFDKEKLLLEIKKYNELTYYNFSNYKLDKTCFKDEVHLNSKGAKIFSKMIKEKLKTN